LSVSELSDTTMAQPELNLMFSHIETRDYQL
jgi:hypothetical protein